MAVIRVSIQRVALVFLCILLIMTVAGRAFPQITVETGETIDAGTQATDMSFFSAEEINLKVSSTDDVFAAGGSIKIDGTSADHLVIAGGEISVRNVGIDDLFAFGGELDLISGEVADDIVVAGGEITVREGFGIGGSAIIAGGEARIEAPVPVDLRVGAGNVYVNSAVGGDARLSGETVTLGPQARIGGDLLYRTENLVIEPGAIVTGRRMILPSKDRSSVEDFGKGAGKLLIMFSLAATVGFAILVVAISFAVPSLMNSSAQFIRSQPFKSVGIGALVAIGVPFIIVLLFATVIGAPLAMLLVAICLAVTPVAVAATAYLIGAEIRSRLAKSDEPPARWWSRLAWPALGALVILFLGMIPILGLLVWIAALLFGLGAVAVRGGKALAANA